jgi:DNA polymerase-3 subunit delta
MPVSALKTLREAIKHRTFEAAYSIAGEDEYQKEDAVQQLVAAALDPTARDFNFDTIRASEIDAESLSVLLSTPPMMADRRVILIKDATALKKDARKVLDDYLKAPAPDLVLILMWNSSAKSDPGVPAGTVLLRFDPLAGDRIPRWIAHHVRTELGAEITEPAAELLHAAVGNDLHQLAAELDKLASYVQENNREIGEDAVAAVVGVRRGETQADLPDAIADRNLSRALELMPHILAQPKTSAVSVVMALSTQMLAIAWGRARLDEGVSRSRLSQEYFDLLRETSAFTGRPWGAAASMWVRAAERWSAAALDNALESLLETDIALKESRVSSEEQLLAGVLLALCTSEDRSAAA